MHHNSKLSDLQSIRSALKQNGTWSATVPLLNHKNLKQNTMKEEPKITTTERIFGNLTLKFEGEQFKGWPIQDTKVSIGNKTLCWISWEDKDNFHKALNRIIEQYEI